MTSHEYDVLDTDLRDTLKSIFIGRDQQLDAFHDYLQRWQREMPYADELDEPRMEVPSPTNQLQGLVVLIYGHGGFGKSTLLRHYHQDASQEQFRFAVQRIIYWESALAGRTGLFHPVSGQTIVPQTYYHELYLALKRTLGDESKRFKRYQQALKDIAAVEKDANKALDSLKSDERFAPLRQVAGPVAMSLLRLVIPQSGPVLDQLKIADKVEALLGKGAQIGAEQLVQVYEKLHEKLGDKLRDYLEPELRLGFALGEDLAYSARNFPLVFFFDTYEIIDEADHLLRLVMLAAGPRVGWVLAGRSNLWGGLEQRRRKLEKEYSYKEIVARGRGLPIDLNASGVGSFSASNITFYFAQLRKQVALQIKLPVVSEQDAGRILGTTLGVPLAVKIAAGLYIETGDIKQLITKPEHQREIMDEMVERYLIHLQDDQSERNKLYGLAMLRRADEPYAIVAALNLPQEGRETIYDSELARLQRRYSFIFTEKDQPSLHQEVRYFLRRQLLRRRNEPAIAGISTRLLAAATEQLKKLEELRKYATLWARLDDDEWVDLYLDLVEYTFWSDPAQGVNYGLAFLIAAAVLRRDRTTDAVVIGTFFATQIKSPYRIWWQWVIQSLIYLNSSSPSPDEFSGLQELAQLAQQHCPAFPLPIPSYTDELQAALYWCLGEAYRRQDNDKALVYYDKALAVMGAVKALKEEAASAYDMAAFKKLTVQQALAAVALLDRAIELKPDFAFTYNNRGVVYVGQRRYEEAIKDCTRAIELDGKDAKYYYNRGNAYSGLKRYNDALKDYTRAIERNGKNAEYYNNRGLAYVDLERYEGAIEDYTKAIELSGKEVRYYSN